MIPLHMCSSLSQHFCCLTLLGLLSLDDGNAEEQAEIPQHAQIPKDIHEELTKAGFPEVEGDLAPSSIVPKACNCITKHLAKIDALHSNLVGVAQPSPLQTRTSVMFGTGSCFL